MKQFSHFEWKTIKRSIYCIKKTSQMVSFSIGYFEQQESISTECKQTFFFCLSSNSNEYCYSCNIVCGKILTCDMKMPGSFAPNGTHEWSVPPMILKPSDPFF